MSNEVEAFKAWLNKVGSRWEHLDAQARVVSFPDDLGSLLDQYEDAANDLNEGKEIVREIAMVRGFLSSGDTHKTKVHILDLKEQIENARHSQYLEGTSRQLSQSAKQRADDIKEERQPHWQAWQDEADRVRSNAVTELSNSEIARRVKKNLNLDESVETIRKRIK